MESCVGLELRARTAVHELLPPRHAEVTCMQNCKPCQASTHPPGALASAKGGHRTLQSAPRLQLPGSGQGFKTLDHTHWLDRLASSAQGAASPRCTSSSFLNSSYSTSTSAPAPHP